MFRDDCVYKSENYWRIYVKRMNVSQRYEMKQTLLKEILHFMKNQPVVEEFHQSMSEESSLCA